MQASKLNKPEHGWVEAIKKSLMEGDKRERRGGCTSPHPL
jgi:hypothetical protein